MKIPPIVNKTLINYFRYIVAGTVVVLLLVGYLAVLAPKITEVQSTETTTKKNKEIELATQQKFLSDLQASNQKFNSSLTTAQREEINDFIPSSPDFPGLLLTIQNIVSQASLTLDSFSVGQVTQQGASSTTSSSTALSATPSAQAATVGGVSFQTQDVSISVSGGSSYSAFKNLLSLFESSRRLFDVISVGYSATVADSKTSNVGTSWTFVLRTYYLPPKP